MIKMESLQDCDQQTSAGEMKVNVNQIANGPVTVKKAEPTVPPDSQFLLGLHRLQDVDEVFQVVEVLGPSQPAAHCSHHLHRGRYHVLVLRCARRERGGNTNILA